MRIGCLCYATEQGVGYLAKSFYDAGVITDMAIFMHDSRVNHTEWYPPDSLRLTERPFVGPKVDAFVRSVDVMLHFETPFDWSFFQYCRERKVRTVLVPMYEWFPRHPTHLPDKIIAPSLLDADYFPGSKFIPVPVDVPWQQRTRARRYLHNAGGIGFREHKGTRQLLEAMKYVKSDMTLTVRSQDTDGLLSIIDSIPDIKKRVVFEFGSRPHNELHNNYDVYVAPEKLNGLSLPLAEARAAGMLVMTTNRYPMNTWLPLDPLIPVKEYHKARIANHLLEFDEATVEPQEIARVMDAWYDKDISEYSLSGKSWAKEMSWEALKPRWLKALSQ